jgi:hypothetical protein
MEPLLMWQRLVLPSFNLKQKAALAKLCKFIAVADNKDKLLKILQYVVKIVLVTRSSFSSLSSGADDKDGASDWKSFASTLSLARRLGRLGNWMNDVRQVVELAGKADDKDKLPAVDYDLILTRISTGASLCNDLLDDWICLQRGRFLAKLAILPVLDLWSTRLWFLSLCIEMHFTLGKLLHRLHSIQIARTVEDVQAQKRAVLDLSLTLGKQCCDWIFCAWELADLAGRAGPAGPFVPVFAGLTAACIGAIRGWRKLPS